MNFNAKQYLKLGLALVKKNAPIILSGLSVVTGGAAVVSAAISRDEHVRLRNEMITEDHEVLTVKEEAIAAGKAYWKTVLLYSMSVIANYSANKNYLDRLALMYAGYKMVEGERNSLEEGVLKTVGPKKLEEINSTIAKDEVARSVNLFDESKIIHTGFGDEIFYDPKSGRYFYSSYDHVMRSFLELEDQLKDENIALNELYFKENLEPTSFGEYDGFGWEVGTRINAIIEPTRPKDDKFGGRVVNVLKYYVHMLGGARYDEY